jgi:hypothetical protein
MSDNDKSCSFKYDVFLPRTYLFVKIKFLSILLAFLLVFIKFQPKNEYCLIILLFFSRVYLEPTCLFVRFKYCYYFIVFE